MSNEDYYTLDAFIKAVFRRVEAGESELIRRTPVSCTHSSLGIKVMRTGLARELRSAEQHYEPSQRFNR
jgi:hypothetical protein